MRTNDCIYFRCIGIVYTKNVVALDDMMGQKRKKLEDGSVMQMCRQTVGGTNGPGAAPSGGPPFTNVPFVYNTPTATQQQMGVRFPPDYNQAVSHYHESVPRSSPPSLFPSAYPHGSGSHQMPMQPQQQSYPTPPISHGQSVPQYSSIPPHSKTLSMAVKAVGSGRNTPNVPSSYGMPGNNPDQPPIVSDGVETAGHDTNPGTQQVCLDDSGCWVWFQLFWFRLRVR